MRLAYSFFFAILANWFAYVGGAETSNLFLKDNLRMAKKGDYLVISSNKTNTLMHIYEKESPFLVIEEIAIPDCRTPKNINWKEWVSNNSPENTSWVMFEIDLDTGKMTRYYSFTKNGWFEIAEADNFLSKLLTLKFTFLPDSARKRIAPRPFSGEGKQLWQPPVVVEGQLIRGVPMNGWRAKWPQDNSDLSGKVIDIYLPVDHDSYPSYFPYWLQVNGAVGKAKVRIVDSGFSMKSPKPPVMKN